MPVFNDDLEQAWERFEVRRAVDQLPEEERSVVKLTHLDGLTGDDLREWSRLWVEEAGRPTVTAISKRTAGDFDVATDDQGRVLVLDPRKSAVRIFVPKDESNQTRGEL